MLLYYGSQPVQVASSVFQTACKLRCSIGSVSCSTQTSSSWWWLFCSCSTQPECSQYSYCSAEAWKFQLSLWELLRSEVVYLIEAILVLQDVSVSPDDTVMKCRFQLLVALGCYHGSYAYFKVGALGCYHGSYY